MTLYAISNKDGSVEIMNVLFDTYTDGKPCTGESEVARWPDEKKSNVVAIKSIANLPTDRLLRNSWTLTDKNEIDYDMAKAKELKLQEFRNLREPLLTQLDKEFMIALEKGLSTTEIVLSKQALRDVTLISLPNAIEELKTFIPDILK
jgi:hypothetical protein